ncbi:MAG: hypothetical protein AB8F74_14575 [Saprospiraceae bacterium]
MNLRQLFKGTFLLLAATLFSNALSAQCATFKDSPKEEDGMAAHSIYRDAIKAKNYEEAFPNWKIAYEIAPAANGTNYLHYSDGRKIYKDMFDKETDTAKKQEYVNMIMKLYDGQLQCYGDAYKKGQDTYLNGRKGYDMLYYFTDYLGDNPYQEVMNVLKNSVASGGNSIEDIILVPYANSVVQLFAKEKISKEDARAVYTQLNEIADYNIANNAKSGDRFKAAKAAMNAEFAQIEYHIFDCDYFVAKLKPEFATKSNDPAFLEESIKTLKRQGCEESNPFLAELESKWSVYATEINAKRQAEFEANNPGVLANRMYKEGDYKGAIAKYEEALAKEVDQSKKAGYQFSIASIQGRKLKQYSKARSNALAAAKMRPGWGDPYMLIADLYATSASGCGDDWNQRLAVLAAIEMYSKAKSIDSNVAADASKKIGRYLGARPAQEEGFMRGVKAGQKAKVGCWIGETVTVKFQ